ncbi:hypothetical protein VOLCADRAFT_90230 [Volvox carteri f. nagariensis]|uniref:Uncharacterized protein n=1 Tax=Volvox carteri f. nagariensis TaxID=3068 RepID=D8TTT8_VOLCA|nr:uncharacterized protein VOLCADRAFT_90230 [Volvox carteri f. nagariensis]EFJ48920.1 hypothetical protein VOLCADRAFT_90230 [Volvox carteri f. nagariensis]|eukprot:XP_002949817.1 hypothetical protein VOLCADRAFT_90230 [Volvox carteri f. nagariensis]
MHSAVDSGRQRSLLQNAQALVAELRALPLDPATTRASYPRMFELVRLVRRYGEATAALPADETRAMWEQRGQWLQEEVCGLAQERIYSPEQQQYWGNLLLLLFTGAEACDKALREKMELELSLQAHVRQVSELQDQLKGARAQAEQAAQRTSVPPDVAEELLSLRSKVAVLGGELDKGRGELAAAQQQMQLLAAERDALRQQVELVRSELTSAQSTAASRLEVIQQLMQRTETSSSQGQAAAAELSKLQVIEKLVELNSELMDNLNTAAATAEVKSKQQQQQQHLGAAAVATPTSGPTDTPGPAGSIAGGGGGGGGAVSECGGSTQGVAGTGVSMWTQRNGMYGVDTAASADGTSGGVPRVASRGSGLVAAASRGGGAGGGEPASLTEAFAAFLKDETPPKPATAAVLATPPPGPGFSHHSGGGSGGKGRGGRVGGGGFGLGGIMGVVRYVAGSDRTAQGPPGGPGAGSGTGPSPQQLGTLGAAAAALGTGTAPKRLVPLQSPRHPQLCRVSQGTATPPGPAPAPSATDSNISFKKGFWTFVDVIAILGSVGGALAAILNLISGTYVLFLPLVLPVVSLLSALQREGLIAEDNRRAYDTLRVSLTRDSTALLADARGALEEVRRELRGQNTTAARLGTIEARLSSLEGSILSASRSAREAAAGLGVLPERLQSEQRAVLEGLVGAMRLELRRAAEALANNETTALARLDARLAAVEGSLSGLEVAQSEGLRRLSMSLNSALADAEATLQSSVRNEVARSMEPVRRLPQMLAAALPPALAAAEAVEASAAAGPAGSALQAIVSQEVEMAVARILDFQADAFGRLNAVRPVPMDDEQWSALGRRLTRLERLVEGVPAGTEGALLQGGQVPAAVAAAVGEALAMQVAEARAEVTAAAAREADSVRNDILAAQTVLRESFDGLAAALQPLQLGVTELQVAVAAVSKGQQEQLQLAQQAAATTEADGVAAAAVAAPPPPPAELARLLDGVEAVARLLRDVDAKMDGVTAAMAQLPTAAAAAAAAAAPPPSSPPSLPKSSSSPDFTAEAVAAAAAQQQQQQWELQNSMESMKEALAALTSQISLMAAQGQLAAAAAPGSAVEPPAMRGSGAAARGSSSGSSEVVDVLSFEASLASGAPPPPPPERAGGGGVDGGSMTSTAGVTRDEAYDMMLQLAEARRRSGSEASSSGSSGGGGKSAGDDGGNAAAAAAVRPAESQLRIVGLPPFEGSLSEGATAAGAAAAAPAAAERQQQPPSQREAAQEVQQPLQQLQPYPEAANWQQQQQPPELQLQQQLQPDIRRPPTVAAAAAATAPPPVIPSAPPAFDGSMPPQMADALQPASYGGPGPLPYDERMGVQYSPYDQQQQQQLMQDGGFQGAGGAQAEQPAEKPSWYDMIQQFTAPVPPPVQPSQQQQQQQQQQQPVWGSSTPPSAPSPGGAAPAAAAAPAPSPPPSDSYRPRPLEGLGGTELISEGLRLLRLGREETRKGEDYGLADSLIQSSIAAFTRAAELPSAASDAKALGNLGNALLARGELKAAYLEALRSGPPPSSPSEAATQRDAERAMTGEANALLTDAGVMFLKLYTSAIDKFEGVLEGEPGMVPAKYRCALAMAGLSRTKPPFSRERLTLLADAINYLRDVVASSAPDAEALRSAAVAALQQYEAQLMTQRAGGRQQ